MKHAPTMTHSAPTVTMVNVRRQNAELVSELVAAVQRVVRHGQYVLGPEVEELEQRWAALSGTRFAVGVSDGTAALTLTLRALGLAEGDEVITAPNSFIASVSAIVHAGGKPRLSDVGSDFNLDPTAVERAVTERTKGIIAVHLAGRPAPMGELLNVAERHGLWILEDAAQAIGAAVDGKPVGSLGLAGCFSLHPLKTLGACGDAGMVTTDDEALAGRLRRLRNHGITKRQEDCSVWGFNARIDTIQAAMVLVKLPMLEQWIARRRANAAVYREHIGALVDFPSDRAKDTPTYQTFPVLVDRRDELRAALLSAGIETAIHYATPIHLLPVAADLGHGPGDFPHAESQARRLISLPIHEGLEEHDIRRVCGIIEGFYAQPA